MTEDSPGGNYSSAPLERQIEEIRREFESTWNSGQGRSIEDYLEDAPVTERAKLLQELLHSEMLLRRAENNPPDVNEYVKRFPQYEQIVNGVHTAVFAETVQASAVAPEFQETVTGQSTPRQISDDKTYVETDRPKATTSVSPSSETEVIQRFGDYDLLSELGRGGMGVVYRARHRDTKRMVALKLIRPDNLQGQISTRQKDVIERFQTEARAAAQLDHEHLVTIYQVGVYEGQHFFSMKYVEGKSLSELLQEGPLGGIEAANFLEPVARALHEAHSHGILHRDLKPQNILIDKKSQRALVTDFGLAKLMDDETNLTQSGEIMGTPQYMSPEQARDSASVTTLADVYSLGATLYHMITGHPPFQAATILETLRLVIDQEPVRPQLLNPAIGQDLQTICLKCLEKDPAKRYASADLLADELERFLEGKPILARPIGIWGRTWRWAKRNKSVAGLLASTVTFLLVAFVAVVVGYIQTAAAYQKAEKSSRETRRAINEYFTMVSEESLLNQAGAHPLRKKLLTKAVEFYQRFLEERKDDPSVRDEVAEAYFRVGRITKEIAAPKDSLVWLKKAHGMQEELTRERPDDVDVLFDLGNTLNLQGEVLLNMKRDDEALQMLEDARTVRLRLTKMNPDRREFHRTLANTYMNLGLLKRRRYREHESVQGFEEARNQMDIAQTIRSGLLAQDADDLDVLRDFSIGAYNLANLYYRKSPADAEKYLNDAVESCRKILSKDETDFNRRYLLATCYRRLGDLMYLKAFSEEKNENIENAERHYEQTLNLYQQAREHFEFLSFNNPNVDEYKSALAQFYINMSDLEGRRKNASTALELSKKAENLLLELMQKKPNEKARYQRDLNLARNQIKKLENVP